MLPSDWWRCGGKGWCRQDGATRLLYTFQMWPHNSDSCPVPCNCHIHAHSTPSSASIFHSFHLVGWVLGYCLIHQTNVICFPSFGNSPNFCCTERASLVAQSVKNQPAVQETLIRFLGEEDPLEKGKSTHSSILAWRIPWAVWSTGWQRVKHDWATFTHFTGVLIDLFFLVVHVCSVDSAVFDSFQPCGCSAPGSSVLGIFSAGVLEWVSMLLQGILLAQGLNPRLLRSRRLLYLWVNGEAHF